MELSRGGSLIGGALIIAGTSIGGGMLALPVLTASAGFIPASIVFIVFWLLMTATGLLFVEIFLWSKEETNIVSMAKMTLGMPGQVVAWFLYLFLFYSLTVAYISGGGHLVKDVFEALGRENIPIWVSPFIFVILLAPLVAIGPKVVDSVNSILMLGLIASFFVFVVLGANHIEIDLLSHMNWSMVLLATPVAITSFGFQGTVPTLTNYLDRDPIKVTKAIVIGSSIALITYIIWEVLILGVVPKEGLEAALQSGQSAVAPLKNILKYPWFFRIGEFLAFFAIVTSFLGVTLGFLDFLSDGLKMKKDVQGRALLALIVFGPPLVFAMFKPAVFLYAVQYGGGLGCALLLALLPIVMVWRGRYALKYKGPYTFFGGRAVLSLMFLFIVLEIFLMVLLGLKEII